MDRTHFISNLTFNEYIFYLPVPVIGMSALFREMAARGVFGRTFPSERAPEHQSHPFTGPQAQALSFAFNIVCRLIIHGQLLGLVQ